MLGTRQKQVIVDGLTRAIRMIRLKKITNIEDITHIVETALAAKRDNTIKSFAEIKTTRRELFSFLP